MSKLRNKIILIAFLTVIIDVFDKSFVIPIKDIRIKAF